MDEAEDSRLLCLGRKEEDEADEDCWLRDDAVPCGELIVERASVRVTSRLESLPTSYIMHNNLPWRMLIILNLII